jgi:L-lactate utilization protein LutB
VQERLQSVLEQLRQRGFKAAYANTAQEAKDMVLTKVQAGQTVGIGGSATIADMGLHDALVAQGCQVFNHNRSASREEATAMRHAQLSCDLFLTSTNALTVKGQMVNVDGTGNRVAAMVFGPKRVVVIAGINKLVDDLDQAMERLKTVAAPKNTERLKRNTPCVQTGRCMDCSSPERICNVYTIIERRPSLTDFEVIIVGEELGY